MNKAWWKESVVYQIYPRSFADSNKDGIGDLAGIVSKLDYLKDLGIDIIWICPVFESPNKDNGYDISDYLAIMKEFGTMEDMELLIEEAHARDIRVILDFVLNHTSDQHPWFIESRASKDNRYRDYFIWREGQSGKEPSNWKSIFGGAAWTHNANTEDYYFHLFLMEQPDLNWENESLRHEVYAVMRWWLDKGIDGFRLDALSHIKKNQSFPDVEGESDEAYQRASHYYSNQPGLHEYLREMKANVIDRYDIVTIAETNGVSHEDAIHYVHETEGNLNSSEHPLSNNPCRPNPSLIWHSPRRRNQRSGCTPYTSHHTIYHRIAGTNLYLPEAPTRPCAYSHTRRSWLRSFRWNPKE
uniref:alpha-amylase family glycosyl hydrolase n=1 Tax=Paenibacillus hexagrammi TaxID=2908839 RepID=UPI00331305E5